MINGYRYMTKRFFLAALAAVALTIGFTACSDDDDDVDAGKYELTVNVHADAVGSDYQEFVTIYNAYRSAFGLGEMNENTDDESLEDVVITGKDSLDCVSSIQKKCDQAEKALKGQEWSDVNEIAIRDANTNAKIYTKQYGAPADNGISHDTFDRVDDYWNLWETPEYFYVALVNIDSRSSTLTYFSELWHGGLYNHLYVGEDLNKGAGGNYVYPSYFGFVMRADDDSWDRDAPKRHVGGMLVLNNESGTNPPAEFWFEDCLYKIAKDANCQEYSYDLNHKAGGSYLYLYTTEARYTGKVLRGDLSEIYWSGNDITDRGYSFVRGVTYGSDKSITLTHPNGIDLNQGAGGKYMYWLEVYGNPWTE